MPSFSSRSDLVQQYVMTAYLSFVERRRIQSSVEQTLSIFKATISHNSCKTFEETKSLRSKKQWKN